jgi:hypothetical protein
MRTDVDHMLRRLVLGSRNVFFAQFLWSSLVRLVLLESRALAHHALFLFNRERPEPVTRLPEQLIRALRNMTFHNMQNARARARSHTHTRVVVVVVVMGYGIKERDVHKVHDGHAPALREGSAPDALPIQRLVLVVFLVFIVLVLLAVGGTLFTGTSAATPPTHERDQLGDEIVNVEGASTRFHRARLGRVHVGRRHEEGRVERRFLWR